MRITFRENGRNLRNLRWFLRYGNKPRSNSTQILKNSFEIQTLECLLVSEMLDGLSLSYKDQITVTIIIIPSAKNLNVWENQKTSTVNMLFQFTWRKPIQELKLAWQIPDALVNGRRWTSKWKILHVINKIGDKHKVATEEMWVLLIELRFSTFIFSMGQSFIEVM